MTVTSTENKAVYAGDSSTTVFSFSFKVDVDTDLAVILTDAAGGDTTQSITTDYTVSRNGDQDASPGGFVTMLAPPAAGEKLTILRELTLTQETDLSPFSSLPAETLEDIADRLTMLAQQINEKVDRGLTLTVSEGAIGTLPAMAARASRFLAFDANGDPIAATTVSGVAVSSFAETMLDDVSASDVRTTIGAADDGAVVKLSGNQKLTAGYDWDTYQVTYDSAVAIDPQNGPTQYLTLTGDATITVPDTNDYSMFLEVIQDATGGRAVTWSGVDAVGGSAIATAANARTEVHIKCTNGWMTLNAREVTS